MTQLKDADSERITGKPASSPFLSTVQLLVGDLAKETKQHVIDYCRNIELTKGPRFRLSGVPTDEVIEHNGRHAVFSEENIREAIAQLIIDGTFKDWDSKVFPGPNWPFRSGIS